MVVAAVFGGFLFFAFVGSRVLALLLAVVLLRKTGPRVADRVFRQGPQRIKVRKNSHCWDPAHPWDSLRAQMPGPGVAIYNALPGGWIQLEFTRANGEVLVSAGPPPPLPDPPQLAPARLALPIIVLPLTTFAVVFVAVPVSAVGRLAIASWAGVVASIAGEVVFRRMTDSAMRARRAGPDDEKVQELGQLLAPSRFVRAASLVIVVLLILLLALYFDGRISELTMGLMALVTMFASLPLTLQQRRKLRQHQEAVRALRQGDPTP